MDGAVEFITCIWFRKVGHIIKGGGKAAARSNGFEPCSFCALYRMIMVKDYKNPVANAAWEYGMITLSILIMAIGVYFFKFPNHFAFGGVTGFSAVVSEMTRLSASQFTFVVNMLLLLLGFIFLGKDFGVRTVYASILLSVFLETFEIVWPMNRPLTEEPLLELVFAVFLPGVGSAILFNIGASSGGTDIIAMILKKHTSMDIGSVLFLVDLLSVVMAFFVFGPTIGLFSALGLMAKSLVVDGVIENINQCKCFNIVCDDPDPICDFIINRLHRGATVYHAEGAFSHHQKTVIMTTMRRGQAMRLRNYIRQIEPTAFILITSSSEIIGKGFLTN